MRSIWLDTVKLPAFAPLEGELRTDVLVIGGGLAGLLCAYMLEKSGINYALIEADTLCGGITANTTAKITAQHGLIYHKLLRQFGAEKARMYLQANQEALNRYAALAKTIGCDFAPKDAYVYTLGSTKKLEEEMRALEKIGFRADYRDSLPLPLPVTGAVRFADQAQFHPLKFAAGIAQDLKIYEHTKALAFDEQGVVTNRGRVRAEKIIVATHFPMLNKHGSYFLKQYQHRTYVLALEGTALSDGMYVDESKTGMSFRGYGDTLLLGGGGHRTGKQGGGWQELSDFARHQYPGAAEKYRWATQDCMTLDGVPYIGQYSAGTPNLYVASGFNKWGVTSSMVAAALLCDLVQGKENPYTALYSPSRNMLRPQLAVNAAEAAMNLLTPTKPRCPHMGCALKWNPQEHSWDCPCHGSRFGADGKLLNNPAADDMKP